MPDIDYGLALDFIDPPDNITYQLRFQLNWAPPATRACSTEPANSLPSSTTPAAPTTAAPKHSPAPASHTPTSTQPYAVGKPGP